MFLTAVFPSRVSQGKVVSGEKSDYEQIEDLSWIRLLAPKNIGQNRQTRAPALSQAKDGKSWANIWLPGLGSWGVDRCSPEEIHIYTIHTAYHLWVGSQHAGKVNGVGCIASWVADNNKDLGSLTSGSANAFPDVAGFGGRLDMNWDQSDPFHWLWNQAAVEDLGSFSGVAWWETLGRWTDYLNLLPEHPRSKGDYRLFLVIVQPAAVCLGQLVVERCSRNWLPPCEEAV